MNSAATRTLWVVTDEKPGHRSQQEGLVERLQALSEFDVHWLNTSSLSVGLWDFLLRRRVRVDLPSPDWILGAGAGTHSLILKLKHIFHAKTILLMRGAYPAGWFDANITPIHDNPPTRNNVLSTIGVMNPVVPRYDGREKNTGTFLIGGINDHYRWDDDVIIEQVVTLCIEQPDVHWTLTDSRRTPDEFLSILSAKKLPNLRLVSYRDTQRGFIKQQLDTTGQLWVTRDSVSMVYECITSGAPVGLLHLTPLRQSRVVKDMDRLLIEGAVTGYVGFDPQHPLPASKMRLWEADRGARWLLSFLNAP